MTNGIPFMKWWGRQGGGGVIYPLVIMFLAEAPAPALQVMRVVVVVVVVVLVVLVVSDTKFNFTF